MAPLDSAHQSEYAFGIVATDGGGLASPDPVAVTVFVLEVNNYYPVFVGGPYAVTVLDDAEVGSVVFRLAVEDADSGASGLVECSIVGGSVFFNISADTCVVFLRDSLEFLGDETFELSVAAVDAGTPPLSAATTLLVSVVPSTAYELEFQLQDSEVEFTEEGEPVALLAGANFTASSDRLVEHTAIVLLWPGLDAFTPDDYESRCLADGVVVDLTACIPNASSLLPSSTDPVDFATLPQLLPPHVAMAGQHFSFVFQSWIKTSSEDEQILLGAYSSDLPTDDQIFVLQSHNRSISLDITSVNSTQEKHDIILPSSLSLTDGGWHHILVALSPSLECTVYVDGQPTLSLSISTKVAKLPPQIHLYTGRSKTGSGETYSGHMWAASISFDYKHGRISSHVSCSLSCGESLGTSPQTPSSTVSLFPYGLTFQSTDFDEFASMLTQLQYQNLASEPSAHLRTLGVTVANRRSEVSLNLTIVTHLLNDHKAVLDTNIQRNIFYYVQPQAPPHQEVVSENILFSDGDTTQEDYTVRVELVPPQQQRSCDRLDYHLKVKLEQCGYTGNHSIYNLLPPSQWGLASLQSVQLYYRSLLGYYFYGVGVLIPDTSIYRYLSFSPAHFSLAFWVQFSGAGTIVHISNDTENFLLQVRANVSSLSVLYSLGAVTENYTWGWEGREEWTHVALVVNASHVELCIDSYSCTVKERNSSSPDHTSSSSSSSSSSFEGLEAYVGAAPRTTGHGYTDHFLGALNGLGLVSDYAISFELLTCITACSEYLTLTGPVPGQPAGTTLQPLRGQSLSGTIAVNGSLQVGGNLRQDRVQQLLRSVAYINSYPYPVPGTRWVNYTVHDGKETVLQATTNMVVLFHNYRNLQLLRVGRVTLSRVGLQGGVKIFGNVGISSDAKTNSMDSLLVEMRGTPADATSCYRKSGAQSCPPIFHLGEGLLVDTSLQLFVQPRKLLVTGLGNVSHYQTLLQEVMVQVEDVDAVLSLTSEISIRVYISDQNGISSSSRTATVLVTDSSSRRRRRDVGTELVNDERSGSSTPIPDATGSHVGGGHVAVVLLVSLLVLVFVCWGIYSLVRNY